MMAALRSWVVSPLSSAPHSAVKRGDNLLSRLGNPRFIAAPMVGQSDLAFRLLVRRHGVDLAYTQMLHSRNFLTVPKYRHENFDPLEEELGLFPRGFDEPLIAQFAGDDPEVVVRAAKLVAGHPGVCAVDLNLGCPQRIAKKGHYGAYLLREPELVGRVVASLAEGLRESPWSCPVTVKMRVVDSGPLGDPTKDTVDFARMLERQGAQLVCLHGRTVKQNKNLCGAPDWDVIRAVNEALEIPVVANGGIETSADALRLLEHTGCAAAMASEALLENPGLFSPENMERARREISAQRLRKPQLQPGSSTAQSSPPEETLGTLGGANTAVHHEAAATQLAYALEYLHLAKLFPPRDGLSTVSHGKRTYYEDKKRNKKN